MSTSDNYPTAAEVTDEFVAAYIADLGSDAFCNNSGELKRIGVSDISEPFRKKILNGFIKDIDDEVLFEALFGLQKEINDLVKKVLAGVEDVNFSEAIRKGIEHYVFTQKKMRREYAGGGRYKDTTYTTIDNLLEEACDRYREEHSETDNWQIEERSYLDRDRVRDMNEQLR